MTIQTRQPMFIYGCTIALACSANELDASNDQDVDIFKMSNTLSRATLKIKSHRTVVKRDTSGPARYQKFREANMKVL
ncbi:hypothetical protein ALC56_01325 [Trachymyrmex septentrionalis]|uniref:Uncharacterized protein n=1 Tax=Trachymyrmex septentrionalis TaxID=34720 RepID=A0A151K0Y3_9HYME|nr:hypothetical protein ALC56_01325 [Trachymyrmex septentrionalis]